MGIIFNLLVNFQPINSRFIHLVTYSVDQVLLESKSKGSIFIFKIFLILSVILVSSKVVNLFLF